MDAEDHVQYRSSEVEMHNPQIQDIHSLPTSSHIDNTYIVSEITDVLEKIQNIKNTLTQIMQINEPKVVRCNVCLEHKQCIVTDDDSDYPVCVKCIFACALSYNARKIYDRYVNK